MQAAGQHDRIVFRAIGRMQRNARQIKRLQNVGCSQLVRHGDTQHVEFGKGRAAFQRKERKAFFAHDVGKFHRGQKRALGIHARLRVDAVHQNANSLVGLAQFVGIGIHHGKRHIVGRRIGRPMHSTEFMVDIAHRAFGARKDLLQTGP